MAIGKLPEADLEGGEDSLFAEINITPLTDIFLVLLIIFMVGSSIKEQQTRQQNERITDQASAGLAVDLPKGAAKEIDPGKPSLTLVIQRGGQVFIDSKAISEDRLEQIFQAAFINDNRTQVIIKADAEVAHKFVVSVMERAKRIGLFSLAIATRGG